MADQRILLLLFVGILWGCVLGYQRPAPRYSQQLMPDTSFTCHHKIIGSYYADPETDCQLFHVCVSVAGSVQDYRFLCPNDTAFDQESQTCADWYDVDCEAATLYYASDNFDLYRLGSGLESLHYDSVRNDVEPLDHLQRSESSDPVRSSANSLNRVSPNSGSSGNNNRDLLKGSSSSNFFNNRNNGKEDDYENDKVYREPVVEQRRRSGVRKVARKQQFNGGNNANNIVPTTAAPSTYQNQNTNSNQNQNNNFNQRQTPGNYPPTTTARPFTNNQKFNAPASTYRPTTNSYQGNNNNNNNNNYNGQQTGFTDFSSNKFNSNQQNYGSTAFDQNPVSTTARSTEYTANASNKKRPIDQNSQAFGNQYNSQSNQYSTQSTTPRPSTSFQSNDFTGFHQKNYNTIQRTASTAGTYPTTTLASNSYDNFAVTARSSELQVVNKVASPTTRQQEFQAQTTPRFANNFAGSSYIPTTYSPVTKNLPANGNVQGQAGSRVNEQYTGQYEASRTTSSAGQYREKSTQQTSQAYKNTAQSYDTTRPNFNGNDNNGQYREATTRAPKKATQYNNYDTPKSNYDGSTRNFDNFESGRAAPSATGFSPSSVNKLAESPATLRPTTPVPRRTSYNSPNTQRPSSAATNYESQTTPASRTASFVSATPRPFSTTVRPAQQQPSTTTKPKSAKKNDYDYAYYDNGGTLEYDGIDLEQITGSRESAKISRN